MKKRLISEVSEYLLACILDGLATYGNPAEAWAWAARASTGCQREA